jgi:predicted DNA-binding protein
MKTITTSGRKKKIIELSPETEKRLRIIAVNAGYNLKSYIENVLDEIAEEDELLIVLSNAEGTDELLNGPEKKRFIKSLSE